MENLYLQNRGLSEMVSYVLLIAIALGISIGVTIFLNSYIPKEKPECKPDVSLMIKDALCTVYYSGSAFDKTELFLTLYNNGLHSIDASYIRFDSQNKKSKRWINDPSNSKIGDSNFYFYYPSGGTPSLKPGDEKSYLFKISDISSDYKEGDYSLEVQPAVFSGNLIAACPSIMSQKVQCRLSALQSP